MTDRTQLPLLEPAPLLPLLVDGHYVPAVQNKKGELDALRTASATTWQWMIPLVHLVGPLTKRTKPFPASTIASWSRRIVEAVGDHPVYLDVMRLDPLFPVETTKGNVPVLGQIYRAARRRDLVFVPVAWAGESTTAHVDLVAEAAATENRGVAVRYRFLRSAVPAGTTRVTILANLLTSLGCEASTADLLIDLEYLDPDEDFDAQSIAASIKDMEDVGPWRSIVVLGTSMPGMLSCIEEGTVGSLPRQEWDLWTQLDGCSLPRLPAFGDYVVQHPRPPAGGGPGMRANIRYTVADQTLVARGEGSVLQEGNEQYVDLCQRLVARPEFSGAHYTWGDGVIEGCARRKIGPGSQNMWRGAGTSHHIRFVTDQLRQRRSVAS